MESEDDWRIASSLSVKPQSVAKSSAHRGCLWLQVDVLALGWIFCASGPWPLFYDSPEEEWWIMLGHIDCPYTVLSLISIMRGHLSSLQSS